MAEETLQLVPADASSGGPVPYLVTFDGQQRQVGGVRHRFGRSAFSGPVAHKIAIGGPAAESGLKREVEVARYLGRRGGELLSKCVAYNFDDTPSSIVVTYRGRSLESLVGDATWPLDHAVRTRIVTDLLRGIELLRVSRIVHGGITLKNLHWDGAALQITDFGQAALSGRYVDGSPAHHGDDMESAGRVIYQVLSGEPPPADPGELRRQIEHVQDAEIRDLLLRRDLVAGTDKYYAFAEDRDRRPTSRMLLDQLDKRSRDAQWDRFVAKDEAVRDDFRRLRLEQGRFRQQYTEWVTSRQPRAAPGRDAPSKTAGSSRTVAMPFTEGTFAGPPFSPLPQGAAHPGEPQSWAPWMQVDGGRVPEPSSRADARHRRLIVTVAALTVLALALVIGVLV